MMWRAILNTFRTAVVLYTVLPEVRPLICNQCSGESGSCSFTPVTCKTGITTCRTTSTTLIYDGQTVKQISNGCGPCSDPISFNTGRLVISKSSSCCTSDQCNALTVAEPRNITQTGLKCQGCFDRSYKSCSDSEETVDCVGAENHCMNASGTESLIGGGVFFAKGCVSEHVTLSRDSMKDNLIQFDENPHFCKSSFCNSDQQGGYTTAVPGVITSSPVMSETTAKESANSNGPCCILAAVLGPLAGLLIIAICC